MKFKVIDLNETKGADPITITIYKNDISVYTRKYADDGRADIAPDKQPSQVITIQNPGFDIPETGTYKIMFDASEDILIQDISSNLHKIVFDGPLFLDDSSEPTLLYTQATTVSASPYQPTSASASAIPVVAENRIHSITISSSEQIINGNGFFAYTKDEYFNPMPLHLTQITSTSDLESVDYVLTPAYEMPTIEGNWMSRTMQFNLENAVIEEGKLDWIIRAPGLKNNQRELFIKSIQITLIKE